MHDGTDAGTGSHQKRAKINDFFPKDTPKEVSCPYLNIKDLMRSKHTSGYFSFYIDNISIKTYSTF